MSVNRSRRKMPMRRITQTQGRKSTQPQLPKLPRSKEAERNIETLRLLDIVENGAQHDRF
jgi:hypothetical protein